MSIPWLSAIKAIPWGSVVEHAPKVLGKARDLIDRQRSNGESSPPSPVEPLSQGDLETHLTTALIEIRDLKEKQKNLQVTLSELAEQQLALASQVKRLRSLLRWLAFLFILSGASLWLVLR